MHDMSSACIWLYIMIEQSVCSILSFHVAIHCAEIPLAPANGTRSGSDTTFGSTVTYTCNHGYSLYSTLQGQVNKITLACMADGNWNGSVPQCKS